MSEKTWEDVAIMDIAKAIYPILYPIEQQDMKIQALHHQRVMELATMVWNEYSNKPVMK
jgi:hypothetical protein